MKKSLAVPLCAAVFLVGCTGASAVVRPGDEESGERGPRYAAGRVVVKLTPEAADQVRQAWDRWGELTPDRLPFEALRMASERNSVTLWAPLLPDAPKDDPSGLGRAFVLTVAGGGDVLQAVQDFSGLTDLVEYAEPDYIAEIQQ